MNLLLVANYADLVGGGERSLLDLAAGLAGRGHEVRVVVPGPGEVEAAARRAGLAVETVPIRPLRGLGALSLPGTSLAFRRLLDRVRPDVLAVAGARGLLGAAGAAGLARVPVVWHVRVAERDPLDPLLARLADRIVANSAATAERFDELSERLRARVRVVPNGIDLGRVARGPEARAAARRALGLRPDAEVVGCVGRFTYEKGQDVLARALAPLLARRPGLHVVFVGDDSTPFGGDVRSILPPGPRVSYLGRRDDVLSLYAGLDVLVVPSRVEGFGRVVVEAFAAEVAVVATDVGGLRETVGSAGQIVAAQRPDLLRAAVGDLLDAPEARSAAARAGRWRAEEEFALERCLEATERVYEEAVRR